MIAGFRMIYAVWSPSAIEIYPQGGSILDRFSGIVRNNDIIELALNFSLNNNVIMRAYDWNTSAFANATYSAMGANMFVVNQSRNLTSVYGANDRVISGMSLFNSVQCDLLEHYHSYSFGKMCIDESILAPSSDGSNPTRQVLFSGCSSDITFPNKSSTFQTFDSMA